MKCHAAWLVSAALCLRLAGEEVKSPPPREPLRIRCDGITTASLAGQDLLYSGRSEFAWGTLKIRVTGQLHVFGGASLSQTPEGVRARTEIESIAGNGTITVSWHDGSQEQTLHGARLVIRPSPGLTGGGSVTLDGRTDSAGSPLPGTLMWQPADRRWLARPPANNPTKGVR